MCHTASFYSHCPTLPFTLPLSKGHLMGNTAAAAAAHPPNPTPLLWEKGDVWDGDRVHGGMRAREYVCVRTLSKQDIGADISEINAGISLCPTLHTRSDSPPPLQERRQKNRGGAGMRKATMGSINDDWPPGRDWESSPDYTQTETNGRSITSTATPPLLLPSLGLSLKQCTLVDV